MQKLDSYFACDLLVFSSPLVPCQHMVMGLSSSKACHASVKLSACSPATSILVPGISALSFMMASITFAAVLITGSCCHSLVMNAWIRLLAGTVAFQTTCLFVWCLAVFFWLLGCGHSSCSYQVLSGIIFC